MKMRVLVLVLFLFVSCVFADTSTVTEVPPITVAQKISYENCTKMFATNKENLYYQTLGAISANRFSIEEIQSTNGYIIFKAVNNKYLATVAEIDSENSILKITPCNNIYFFQPGILINVFKYIDLNIKTEAK